MPISHTFHHGHNVIVSRWTGKVHDKEALDSYEQLYASDEWIPGLNELADLSECDMSEFTTDGLRGIAKLVREAIKGTGKDFRSAVIAQDDLAYMLVHMYGLINAESKEEAHVFRSASEACDWIGVPPQLLD